MTLIACGGVAIAYGADTILRDVTFTVARGDRWGIVGRNGAGKTSLIRVLTGAVEPAAGSVARQPGLRLSLLDQHRDFAAAASVWDAAAGPLAGLLRLERELAELATRIGEAGERDAEALLDRYARDLERFEREGGYTAVPRVDAILQGLGFDPAAARTTAPSSLSGGELGRIGIARQLLAPGDILLLDEPTNHLDLDTADWLADWLESYDGTVLLVSHDRAFLEGVVDHVLHVDQGTATPYEGDYNAFVRQRAERRLTQQRAFDRQRKVLAGEEDFIRRNIAGQNSRQAKGRRRRLERVERLSPPPGEAGAMTVRLAPGDRGGDQVLICDRLQLRVGERTLLRGFTGTIRRGEVVGLVGQNGAGKSTLLRCIGGERAPDGGELRLAPATKVAWYRQDLSQVPRGTTVYDAIADRMPHWPRGAIQSHLGRFDFSGDTVLRRTDALSGGERARLALALLELDGANFLVFDEPTNHLDVESIEALEDALRGYEGTAIVVSHDRAFLRAVVTRVWAFEGGRITDYPDRFEAWEAAAAARRAEADEARAAEQRDARRERGREREQARERDRAQAAESRRPDAGERRRAQRAAEGAEAAVAAAEAKVAELTAALADPALYAGPDGARRGAALGAELDRARAALEEAMRRWSEATELLESLG